MDPWTNGRGVGFTAPDLVDWWTRGPMDPWTRGPVDLWTRYERSYPWHARIPLDPSFLEEAARQRRLHEKIRVQRKARVPGVAPLITRPEGS